MKKFLVICDHTSLEVMAESAIGGFVNFTNLKKESQPAVVALLTGRTIEEVRPTGDQKEKDSDDKYVDPKAKGRVPKFSRGRSLKVRAPSRRKSAPRSPCTSRSTLARAPSWVWR